MSIRFNCRKCGKWLKANARHAGKRAKCTGCGAEIVVPTPEPAQAAAPRGQRPLPNAPSDSPDAPARGDRDSQEGPPEPPLDFRRKPPSDDGLDMTPMVDVTFLLLIFFMVTAAFSLQKAIEHPTPESTEGASQSRTIEEIENSGEFVVVKIDKDSSIWVDEVVSPSEQDLLSKLRAALRGADGGRGRNAMLVLPSDEARHETVVKVLDAGTAAGMESVRLTNAQEDL